MTLETHRNWRNRKSSLYNSFEKGFSIVEKMFFMYKQIKKEVGLVRSELGYYGSGHKEGGGSSNHAFISDPTASIAEKHIRKLRSVSIPHGKNGDDIVYSPEDWLDVIDKTLKFFDENEPNVATVLRARYIQNDGVYHTCDDLHVSVPTYYRFRDIGIRYARECAIQMGLVKVF